MVHLVYLSTCLCKVQTHRHFTGRKVPVAARPPTTKGAHRASARGKKLASEFLSRTRVLGTACRNKLGWGGKASARGSGGGLPCSKAQVDNNPHVTAAIQTASDDGHVVDVAIATVQSTSSTVSDRVANICLIVHSTLFLLLSRYFTPQPREV